MEPINNRLFVVVVAVEFVAAVSVVELLEPEVSGIIVARRMIRMTTAITAIHMAHFLSHAFCL